VIWQARREATDGLRAILVKRRNYIQVGSKYGSMVCLCWFQLCGLRRQRLFLAFHTPWVTNQILFESSLLCLGSLRQKWENEVLRRI